MFLRQKIANHVVLQCFILCLPRFNVARLPDGCRCFSSGFLYDSMLCLSHTALMISHCLLVHPSRSLIADRVTFCPLCASSKAAKTIFVSFSGVYKASAGSFTRLS